MIPNQLKNCGFCRVQFREKRAFETGWQNKPYSYEEISQYFPKENYGVICGKEVRVLDDDTPDKILIKLFLDTFGETFRVRDHLYFKFDNEHSKKIILYLPTGEHAGEIQGENTYVVGPGSTHPTGEIYEQKNNELIQTISYEKFIEVFKDYIKSESSERITEQIELTEEDKKIIEDIKGKWKEGDRQNLAMYLAGYLRKNRGFGFDRVSKIIEQVCIEVGDKDIQERLGAVKETYMKDENQIIGVSGLKNKIAKDSKIFTKEGQIESFHSRNPFFYDKSKLFFVWNHELKKYELSDEIDMLNQISEILGVNTISSKHKAELISGFQQIGRRNIPKTAPDSWVQFKDKICDFKTGEIFEATPEYFITSPIPWSIGESEETPTIDRLLTEWVGEDYKETLIQLTAYCSSSDQFMQRLIALVGGGSNGKGTFLKLLKRFLGSENIVTSELKEISENQFETASIYRKLVCFMGEVSYNDLKNTNQIKKLAGEDDIRYCFKGKTPFTDKSITTVVCATNSLPNTPDKTLGFYRRWLIIDFPNQFTEIKKGLISGIPDWEFENLAKKVLRVLKELYESQRFTNEGDFEERMNRYEERSNPVLRFLEQECEEIAEENLELKEFSNKFNEFAKEHHLRILSVVQIGKILREEGFEIGNRKVQVLGNQYVSKKVILNLRFKKDIDFNEMEGFD